MRSEFEALTRQLNKTFNVKMVSWNDFKAVRSAPADTVEQMPHITQRLQDLWGTQEAQAYIHQILRDNRNGTRQGFPSAWSRSCCCCSPSSTASSAPTNRHRTDPGAHGASGTSTEAPSTFSRQAAADGRARQTGFSTSTNSASTPKAWAR
jgi:hypothetical protein